MNRSTTKRVHAIAGALAMLLITAFFVSSIAAELFASLETIAFVKRSIAWALIILIPALAATGGSGNQLSGKSKAPLITKKKKRMAFAAANGLIILVPCAMLLNALASKGAFDRTFYIIQAVELVAGAVNILLLGLNFRDGLKMSRGKPAQRANQSTEKSVQYS